MIDLVRMQSISINKKGGETTLEVLDTGPNPIELAERFYICNKERVLNIYRDIAKRYKYVR